MDQAPSKPLLSASSQLVMPMAAPSRWESLSADVRFYVTVPSGVFDACIESAEESFGLR